MALQVVADYYRCVLENERIYYEYQLNRRETVKNSRSEDEFSGSERTNALQTDEQLQLQRQVNKLTVDLQSMAHENERLREFQKTQKQILESKIQQLKKTVDSFKNERNSSSSSHVRTPPRQTRSGAYTQGKDTDLSRRGGFHLLSPIVGNVNPGKEKAGGLKETLKVGRNTIFDKNSSLLDDDDDDDDDDEINGTSVKERSRVTGRKLRSSSSLKDSKNNHIEEEEAMEFTTDNSDEVGLMEGLKLRDGSAKANLQLPSGSLSPDEDTQSSNEETTNTRKKRRRLTRRRIQTMNSDNSSSE
ncbi:Monopolin complex subunit LRS4 [Nakaseomyces glabratus]